MGCSTRARTGAERERPVCAALVGASGFAWAQGEVQSCAAGVRGDRMSGRLWQQQGLKRDDLQHSPGRKAMNRVRERVRALTSAPTLSPGPAKRDRRAQPGAAGLGAVLPNGQRSQPRHRRGRLRREEAEKPAAQARWASLASGPGPTLGSRRPRKPGIASPARDDPLPGQTSWKREDCVMLRADGPLVSRVREIRMRGLNGGVGSVTDLRA